MHGSKDQLAQDTQLVHRILAGDTRQMNELARRYTAFMERTLIGRGAEPAEAEDVVAALWIDCLPRPQTGESLLRKFKGDTPLQSWLLTVASRRLIDLKRRQRPRGMAAVSEAQAQLHDRPAPAPRGPGEDDLTRLLLPCLRQALGSCSAQELLILRLVHMHGLTQREISSLWGLHESSISRLLKQAMDRIERRTLLCARTRDPWLDLAWEDFLALCEAEIIL